MVEVMEDEMVDEMEGCMVGYMVGSDGGGENSSKRTTLVWVEDGISASTNSGCNASTHPAGITNHSIHVPIPCNITFIPRHAMSYHYRKYDNKLSLCA